MFTRIVVGFDGSQGGHDAFALARALASPHAEIVLVAAVPFERYALTTGIDALMRADAQAGIDLATAQGRTVRMDVVDDWSPGRAMHRAAEDEHADLVVIGSAHRGAVGRVLIGDTSRAVLHGASCPVAIAPRHFADESPRIASVGVGVIQTAEARAAIRLGAAIARQAGGELRLLTAVPNPASAGAAYAYAFDWSEIQEADRADAERELALAASGIEGVPVQTEAVAELPAPALEALSERVDLLVVGSRGWGAVRRVLLGSTTDRLTHRAHCPVLVVPRPAGVREETGTEALASV